MSGFAVWAQSPAGTLALTGCGLVAGMILGYLTGWQVGYRRAEWDQAEDVQAGRGGPQWADVAAGAQIPNPSLPSAPDKFAAIREAGRRAWQIQQEQAAAWEAHADQAVALASEDRAFLDGINERLDRWLAENVYGVPYSAGEPWSGQ